MLLGLATQFAVTQWNLAESNLQFALDQPKEVGEFLEKRIIGDTIKLRVRYTVPIQNRGIKSGHIGSVSFYPQNLSDSDANVELLSIDQTAIEWREVRRVGAEFVITVRLSALSRQEANVASVVVGLSFHDERGNTVHSGRVLYGLVPETERQALSKLSDSALLDALIPARFTDSLSTIDVKILRGQPPRSDSSR